MTISKTNKLLRFSVMTTQLLKNATITPRHWCICTNAQLFENIDLKSQDELKCHICLHLIFFLRTFTIELVSY